MKWKGLHSLFFLSAVFSGISPVFSQSSQPPEIINLATELIKYCSDSEFLASEVSIRNLMVTVPSGEIKVSIINFNREEDVLGLFLYPD